MPNLKAADPCAVLNTLLADGGTLVGVPCSYFDTLLRYAASSASHKTLIAPDEAQALAFAAGVRFGGGSAITFLQNSGIGACIDPITSILMPFGIRADLLISHRGHPGMRDRAHHLEMGSHGHEILEAIGVDVEFWDDAEIESLERFVTQGKGVVRALLTAPDVWRESAARHDRLEWMRPHSRSGLGAIVRGHQSVESSSGTAVMMALLDGLSEDVIVITGVGLVSRLAYTLRDRDLNLYLEGGMGLVPAFAAGLASMLPNRKVIAVQGDGSALMRLSSLAFVGSLSTRNLLYLVIDNGMMLSTGGQVLGESGGSPPFGHLAALCGLRVSGSNGRRDIVEVVRDFVSSGGPGFLHCRVGKDVMPPRVGVASKEQRARFRLRI